MDGKLVTRLTEEVLTFLFSDGPRVCVEIALMAAHSGALPLDQDWVDEEATAHRDADD